MCTGMEIFSLISGGMQMASQISQANQARDMGNYQAAQAEADAQAEREVARVNAEKIRKASKSQQSAARSALAASGVVADAGTALMIQGDIAQSGEGDALSELLTGKRRSNRLEAEGAGARIAGKNAQQQGYMGAAGSLLATGGKMGSKYGGIRAEQAPAPVINRNWS